MYQQPNYPELYSKSGRAYDYRVANGPTSTGPNPKSDLEPQPSPKVKLGVKNVLYGYS